MRANGVSAFSPSQRSNCKAWPDAADSLALVLEMMGARIEVAYDGEGALAAADREVPQIALLDLGMPVMERAPLGEVRRHARGLLAAPSGGVADGELVECGIAHLIPAAAISRFTSCPQFSTTIGSYRCAPASRLSMMKCRPSRDTSKLRHDTVPFV